MFELIALVILHGPDGHEILLNPTAVTSMHSAIEGRPNENITGAVKCLINTSDGKFVSVIESCAIARKLFEQSGYPYKED